MPQEAATPPTQPTPPTRAGPAPGQVQVQVGGPSSAADVYQAFRAQRRELGRQLESLEEKRGELQRELQSSDIQGAARTGIERRISEIDQRIADIDKQIAASDQSVANAAAVPGATAEPPPPPRQGPPNEVFVLVGILLFVGVLPLSIAYARRIWRRGAAAVASLPKELGERLTRIEQAIDAMAVEVERVGEGQRYMTKQLGESAPRAIGAGAAESIALPQREVVGRERR